MKQVEIERSSVNMPPIVWAQEWEPPARNRCCYVHFFVSEEAARTWVNRSERTYIVSLAEGFEYACLFNHAQLGAALEEVGV